jgi:SEC-C motif-containing protein
MTQQTCPCLSGKQYKECCQPKHDGSQPAETAEQLMRSRYSAFVLGLVDYLINTVTPSQRTANDHAAISETGANTNWLGLKIIDHNQHQDQAEVEFVAFYQDDDSFAQLHERSQFVQLDGSWFYQTGDFLPAIKLNRNEPCFCGSGKKFKRCHG